MNQQGTRRAFLAGAGTAGAALAAGTAGAHAVGSGDEPSRRVINGAPSAPFSRAIVFGNVAHVSGVLGMKSGSREPISPEFEPQCRQALENLKASVEASGSSMEKVLKCTCFLTDAADFEQFNTVYREFFPKDPPARSTVVVKELVVKGARIEIDCVAGL